VAECCSIDFSMVARHLAALARAGLLEARKDGRTVWYQARAAELSARFHELGEAITEWSAVDGRGIEPSSGSGGCCK
jgi:ArsR family transcriptional regulator